MVPVMCIEASLLDRRSQYFTALKAKPRHGQMLPNIARRINFNRQILAKIKHFASAGSVGLA